MFLRVTLDDGRQYVGEFSKLGNVQRYATQVMAGVKPFNVWQVVARVHPASGEPCLMRTRVMLSGRRVQSVEMVQPVAEAPAGTTDPLDFEPVVEVQHGEYGLWTAPTEGELVEGAEPGMKYPVHVEPTDLQRYVVLRAADDAQAVGERRYYLQRDTTTDATPLLPAARPGDGDEDVRDEDYEGL